MVDAIRGSDQADSSLQRVVEPLASYICATEQPQICLRMALALLFREVEQTNQAARDRLSAYSIR